MAVAPRVSCCRRIEDATLARAVKDLPQGKGVGGRTGGRGRDRYIGRGREGEGGGREREQGRERAGRRSRTRQEAQKGATRGWGFGLLIIGCARGGRRGRADARGRCAPQDGTGVVRPAAQMRLR